MIAKKVAVIGLDAADWEFMQPWMDAGDLPNISRLCAEGARGPLASTNPPFSGPAWATFMTGLQPGGHGLFDFVMEDPHTGRPVMARSDLIRGAKLWEVAARAGKRSVVVNVPITWPPKAFDGCLVTGMLTPEGKPFTHPPELGDEIRSRFPTYRCDLDIGLKERPETLKAHLDDMAFQNLAVMRTLAREKDWDLFVGVFTTTDRAKHTLWDQRETLVRDHYRHVDRAVGELIEELGDDVLVLLLSDHGFHSVRTKFYVNRWLRENGWLEVREATPDDAGLSAEEQELHKGLEVFMAPARAKPGFLSRLFGRKSDGVELEIDPERSRAYLYSAWSNGIKINVKGRGAGGTVEPGEEYERLRDAIIDGLRALTFPDSEEPLFDFVGRREEVYHGAQIEWAPDVVTRSDGFRVICGKNLDTGRLVRVSSHDSGQHSDTGIVVLHGPGVEAGTAVTGAGIVDAMPTVLWALGVPVPDGLDGRPLTHAFSRVAIDANPVESGAASADESTGDAGSFNADEEEELRKTLEGLGYI